MLLVADVGLDTEIKLLNLVTAVVACAQSRMWCFCSFVDAGSRRAAETSLMARRPEKKREEGKR